MANCMMSQMLTNHRVTTSAASTIDLVPSSGSTDTLGLLEPSASDRDQLYNESFLWSI
jgi:hypothetical protein